MANRSEDHSKKFESIFDEMESKYGSKRESENTSPATTAMPDDNSSSKNTKQTQRQQNFDDIFSEMEARYNKSSAVNDTYINAFLRDAQSFLNRSADTANNLDWQSATSKDRESTWNAEYLSLREREENIRSYLRENKDKIDSSTYDELVSLLDTIRRSSVDAKLAFRNANQYYSRWESEDDYLKAIEESKEQHFRSSKETREDRQNRYSENQKRIEDLKAERQRIAGTQVNNLAYSFGDTSMGFFIPASDPAYDNRLKAIDDEIASIEADMHQYERGEGGYTSKTVDDYYTLALNPDFEQGSANRDFGNATRTDFDKWYYQTYGGAIIDPATGREVEGSTVNPGTSTIDIGSLAINDPLGFYLETMSGVDQGQYAYTSNGVISREYDQVMVDASVGSWDQLEDGEINIYYYLFNTQGADAAKKYLEDMKVELNRRATDASNKYTAGLYDEANVLGKVMLNAATVPANVFGGTIGFVEDTIATIKGEDINPYSSAHSGMHFSNTVRQETAEDLDESGFVIPVLDFSLSDIYQVGMSRLDSALATGIGNGMGTVLLGMGAAENEAYRLYQSGASPEQVTLGALAAGAAEAAFEYLSFDKLIKMKDAKTVGQWVVNALIQGGIEASEEGFTEIANILTNAIIMGGESDIAKLYKDNNGDSWKTFLRLVQQTAQATFGGFLGGAGAGATQGGKTYINTQAQYADAGRTIMGADGGVDSLMNLANEVAGVSSLEMQKDLKNLTDKVSKKATSKNVGRLYDTVQKANNLANAPANQADIAKSLERKGFSSETANDIAEALVASYNGQELTKAQSKLLKSAKNSKVVQDAISNIVTNAKSTMGQRSQNIRSFSNDIALARLAKDAGVSVDTVKKMADGKLTTVAENASETHYEVSADGKMENTKTGDVIEPQGLVQAEDGTYKIAVKDADPVSPGEVSYADNNQALVYETFVNLEKHSGKISKVIADMNLKSRNELIGLYNPKVNKDGGTFVNGVLNAYFYGHRGIDMATASKDSPMLKLTPEQRAIAWNTGRAAGMQSTTAAQSNIDTVYAEAKKILEEGKSEKESYRAVLDDGITMESMNEKQRDVYHLADQIAQGVQAKIHVYAGKNKEQGFYNHETDEIWLNLNAAKTGREHIMAFTLAHELVHRAKDGSLAKYQAFVDFLMKEYGKQGSNVEAMIAEQIRAAEEFNKTVPNDQKVNMTREKALEEVVCDACQRMFLDTNAGEKLAEFGAKSKENKSFLEDLKRWITELLNKLRSYFKNAEPDSLAAKEFAKFDANVKQILADMYVDMSIEAGEKLSTIKAAYGGEFAQKFHGLKDIRYNLAAVDTHKAKLQKEFSEDSSSDLKTLMARYDKIIDIWTRLGGELNSKFLAEWNSKVSKDRTFTIFKAQAGYKYNVELSSMCKKGVPLFEAIDTIVKKEVMKELEIDALGKAEKEILYDILKQHHFEIPCAICYVEQARQREGVIIDAFLNGKVETNAKGVTTKVKLGWNQVLESIEKEMKANGVDYTFAQVSRDIATEKYIPANLAMDSKTQVAFYAALMKIANQEIARYNKAKGKSRKLLSDVTQEAVQECFKGTLPANLKIFKVLFEEPSSRFKIQKDLLYSSVATQNLSMAHNKLYGLFNMQGGVSGYKTKQGTTIYWGDILGKSWKPDTLRNEGGVRNQSNSDFQMYTLLDQAQMYMDFTAKGYYLQAYTKVLSELKLFGLSRGKINASLIPKVVVYRNADGSVDVEKTMASAGLDENGNPIYDDIEGINHAEAFMLIEDPEYSKSICGICIGYSDAHINKLLDDPRVQQIIGFHDKTDDGTKRYKGARYAKNYNGLNEAVNSEGKTVHIGFNPYVKRAEKKFQFNAETETYEGTIKYNGKTYTADDIPRLAADLYLEMCAKKGYTPAYKDFAGHRNYYKLLADFGLYDSQGHYAPHRKVVYNMPDTVPYLDADGKKQTMSTYDYIKAELVKELTVRDSIAEALADTSDEGIIPQFKAAVKKRQAEKSYSLPKVFSDSIEKFGTTTDFAEAGFILPNGEMLKFTDDKHRGERQYDHRAIGMVYGIDVDLGVNHGFNKESGKFVDDFVENGGIRFDAGHPDLNMDVGLQLSSTVPITKAQEQLIRDLVKWTQNREELFEANLTEENFLYTGPLAIRIDFGGDSQYAVGAVSAKDLSAWGKKSLEYDGGNINADRIIADIRHYYQTGETRQQSLVSQFHYSYSLPKTDSEGKQLTLEQQEFFKESKVRDEYGRLIRVFHGTDNGGFAIFQTTYSGEAYWFADRITAGTYTDLNQRDDSSMLYEVYLNAKNPLVIDADGYRAVNIPTDVFASDGGRKRFHHIDDIAMYAQDNGYDGLIVKNVKDYGIYIEESLGVDSDYYLASGTVYAVFKPEQIKNVDNTMPTSNPDIRYSLPKVSPVQPTTSKWRRTHDTDEVKAQFPDLWDVAAEESEVRNPTQISGTVKSYRKIYEYLKAEGFRGSILDASSGLGYGTKAGIEEYGFDVEDIEPYPDNSYSPKYTDYSALHKKYDVIISNAVLNVLPQDQRDALVVKMASLLRDGGRIFINVRGRDVENASSKIAIDKDLMEYYISNTDSYQKGFTKTELVAYLEDALGEGYRVNTTSMFGAVSAVVTKINPYEGKKLYESREVYDYDFMTARDSMTVATMPSLSTVKVNGKVSPDKAVSLGLENAKQLGREVAENQYAVVNAYTGREIIIGQHGLDHSLDGENIPRLRTNARLSAIGGELVHNAIPINGLRNKNRQAAGTYAMACLVNDNDSKTVAIITVEEHTSKVVDIGYVDITHSVNGRFLGKKGDSRSSTREPRHGLNEAALATAISEISIADFLKIVNMTHRSILSDSVLQEFEERRPSDGYYTDEVLFKLPIGEDTSPRALLANAFEGIITNDIEKRRLQEYKGKVEMLNAEEAKLRELRAEIKELSFAKGKRDTKRIKELQFEAMHTANRIATLDKMLLRLEAAAPLQSILKREKEMAYKRAEQKGKEALEAYRKAEKERDEQWQREVKDKYQASKKKAIETRDKREAREKLQKLVLDTVKWITYPSKTDVKCPDILKQPYADFLNGIDLSSQRLAKGGDPTQSDLRLANAMGSLATALERVMASQDPTQETTAVLDTGYLDLPANFVQKLRDMTEDVKAMMGNSEYVVNRMPAEEVRKLTQMIRTLNHAIKEVSTLYANLRFANVEALGDNTMSFIDELGEIEKAGGVKDFVQWNNALPYYAFKRFGKGGESIFEGLMDAQDKLAFLAQKIFDFRDKAWTEKEAKAWSEDTHTIELPNDTTLTLTTADAMSIYCLSRRQQGLQHLLGGGTRVMGIQKGSQKAKDSRSLLTIKDIEVIISSLTDRQKQVADAIQEFMSTTCSEWGNEISMKRFLTREFTEKFYFPIESNDENLATKDPSAQQSDLFRLLNISATKPIDPRANNEVIIRNIFDVFTNHASDMARLNAYGMPLLDYMKWLNYREKTTNEEGQIKVRGVRKSMELAFGSAARSYVLNLVKDINGRPSDGGIPPFFARMLRNAKTAMVGSSLRVATLQITSYPRAALVLSPKSLTLGLSKLPQIEKAKKYCGIALWKSFGFYDTNISRSIEDQIKGVTDVKQKLIELSLKGAEIGDAITWGCLWNACEYEVVSTKQYKVGTEEFYQAVGKKLREVVYRTQVVDSALTRSEMMRSKNMTAQELSAFMSEPTLSANILMDAGLEFNMEKRRSGSAKSAWQKTGKYVTRSIAVYSIGQLTAALPEGFWDAWRDDDDEEFSEKFLNAFRENMILDLLPFNKIPIISDLIEMVLSLFGLGYFSSDSISKTALTQTVSAVQAWSDVLGGKSSATAYNAIYKSMRAISSFLGVSISGVMREAVALWNNTAGAYDITWKIRTWDMSKTDLASEALDAILEGNDRQASSIRAEFPDDDSYQSAMRTAIKDRYTSGGIDYDTAIQYLIDYCGMEEDTAYWKAEEWMYESETGDDFSKYNEFFTAVETGKNLKMVIKQYTENGVAMETLATQITNHYKPLYIEMSKSEKAGIKGYLLNAFEQCGVKREDATKKLQYWEFLSEQPDTDLSQYQIADYYEFAKPAGISADLYSDYCTKVSGIEGEDKKERRMAVINSMPLTNAQKDALYFAEGWAKSKISDAPWH